MKQRYNILAQAISESELFILEDAINLYIQQCTDDRKQIAETLRADIINARRWRHQFGKSSHDD